MYCPNPDCPDLDAQGIPGEYFPEVTHCPICGAALVAEMPEWVTRQSASHDDKLVSVLKVTNAALLPLAKSLLESAGIDFTVRNELVQGLIGWGQVGTGFNVLTGPPEILVEERNLDEARTLLERLGQSD
jgi:hypothetical protein